MDRNLKIAHLSSAHPRDDQRILTRQCVSLARAGHDVHLVVADGRGAGETDGVRIHDTGCPTGRLERAVLAARRVAAAAAALRPDIVQLHDPEIVPHEVANIGVGQHLFVHFFAVNAALLLKDHDQALAFFVGDFQIVCQLQEGVMGEPRLRVHAVVGKGLLGLRITSRQTCNQSAGGKHDSEKT